MISSSKKEFIIEYRPSSIRIIRVSSLTTPLTIEAIEEVPLGDDADAVASKVRKIAGAKANGYMNGVCVIYPDRRIVRQMSLDTPKGTEAEFIFKALGEALNIPAEISAHCLSPVSGAPIDPEAFNKKEVIVCGIPNPDIVDVQKKMLEHGIYPSRIELGTVGIVGALQDALTWQGANAPALFLEVERDFSNAIIVGPKGIEMSRRIDSGAADIATALKEELNLNDDTAANRLLASKDFDFSSIARKILRRLMRDLQSSIGFYEVQTGQSVHWIHCATRANPMGWLEESVGDLLNLRPFEIDLSAWLKANGVESSEKEDAFEKIDLSWIGQISALCGFKREEEAA